MRLTESAESLCKESRTLVLQRGRHRTPVGHSSRHRLKERGPCLNEGASYDVHGEAVKFFFFQAEDGIRYLIVTGVQTCAFFFSSRRRHTRSDRDWSSDVCSSDLKQKTAYEI